MAQWLQTLPTLAKNLGLVPSTYRADHHHLQHQFQESEVLLCQHVCAAHMCMQAETCIPIEGKSVKKHVKTRTENYSLTLHHCGGT